MTFMMEGGSAMWVMVLVAAIAAGLELRRSAPGSRRVPALEGGLAVVALAIAGFAGGMRNTVAAVATFEAAQQVEIMGIGTRESTNNLLLGAGLALLLGVVHVARTRMAAAAAA